MHTGNIKRLQGSTRNTVVLVLDYKRPEERESFVDPTPENIINKRKAHSL